MNVEDDPVADADAAPADEEGPAALNWFGNGFEGRETRSDSLLCRSMSCK